MVYQFGEDFWGHSHRLNPAFWNVCQQAVVNYLNFQILDKQDNQTDTQTQLSPPLPHSRILKIGKPCKNTGSQPFSAQLVFCVISSASYFNARFDLTGRLEMYYHWFLREKKELPNKKHSDSFFQQKTRAALQAKSVSGCY